MLQARVTNTVCGTASVSVWAAATLRRPAR